MELITTHTHTNFTDHGDGSIEELISAAEACGITTLAITEHFPLSEAMDPQQYLSMRTEKLPLYLEEIAKAKKAHPHIEILCGTELDWLGDFEDRTLSAADFEPFDIILGSVHFVDGWAFDDPAERGRWDEVGPDAIWRRYFEIWCEAVTSDAPFQIMAHPDLAKKFGIYPSFDLMPLYEMAAEACASSGRMIEVNTSGAHYACAEMYPAPDLLRSFCRAGVPCTVGTDAHTPGNVARGIEQAYRLMAQAGYQTVTVPTANGGRRNISIA